MLERRRQEPRRERDPLRRARRERDPRGPARGRLDRAESWSTTAPGSSRPTCRACSSASTAPTARGTRAARASASRSSSTSSPRRAARSRPAAGAARPRDPLRVPHPAVTPHHSFTGSSPSGTPGGEGRRRNSPYDERERLIEQASTNDPMSLAEIAKRARRSGRHQSRGGLRGQRPVGLVQRQSAIRDVGSTSTRTP